jgi:hypothetical protein
MATARVYLAGCGIQTSALGFAGVTTVKVGTTEEYTDPSFAVRKVTLT